MIKLRVSTEGDGPGLRRRALCVITHVLPGKMPSESDRGDEKACCHGGFVGMWRPQVEHEQTLGAGGRRNRFSPTASRGSIPAHLF